MNRSLLFLSLLVLHVNSVLAISHDVSHLNDGHHESCQVFQFSKDLAIGVDAGATGFAQSYDEAPETAYDSWSQQKRLTLFAVRAPPLPLR